jgi:hypothetical protein
MHQPKIRIHTSAALCHIDRVSLTHLLASIYAPGDILGSKK